MALTDTAVRQAKPKQKPYSLADYDGLSLYVRETGGVFDGVLTKYLVMTLLRLIGLLTSNIVAALALKVRNTLIQRIKLKPGD